MSRALTLEQFEQDHPWPDAAGIDRLFRFGRIDPNHPERLKNLFLEGKLYHALPAQLNDPFECRPNFVWLNNAKQVGAIRTYLINVAMSNGRTRGDAEALVASNMKKEGFVRDTIYDAINRAFSEIRICCFTTKKENLLFWSHYADAHKGFCVEFDATTIPANSAYKVRYLNDYPEEVYPRPEDLSGLRPALVKSSCWEYEQEFRTLFAPEAEALPMNDGESIILGGAEITRVYLGACMPEHQKDELVKLIGDGPFKPDIFRVHLSNSSYSLEFSPWK